MSDVDDIGNGPDGDRLLVAEYVLGLLDAAEHERVARRMVADPALAAEQRLWQLRLQGLDTEFTETPAPAAVLGRIEARLFETKPAAGAGWWNSLLLWRGLAAAGVAVAAIAIGINVATPRVDPNAVARELVAAIQAQGSDVSFVALYDPQSGSVRLTSLSGGAVPDKDYELWAIQGGNAPVSMGVIKVGAKAEMKLGPAVAAGFGEGTVLAVTLEQAGGSPTGAPQGPIVAKGAATSI